MSRSTRIPRLRKRRSPSTGRWLAYAKFNGRTVSFGRLDEQARNRYRETVARWLAAGCRLPDTSKEDRPPYLIEDLVADYLDHAMEYYRNRATGEAGGEYENVKLALKPVLEMFSGLRAAEFGPLALRAVREALVDSARLCRREINFRVQRIRRAFRWAASVERIPASVREALTTLEGLQAGRTSARESVPVKPVSESAVRATVKHLPLLVADMVWFQWWTGCRPAELVTMKWREIDRTGPVWIYRPESHKTSWSGRERLIPIGPRAREFLTRHQKLDRNAFVFSPIRSEEERNAKRRAERRSPMTPSQVARRRKARRKRPPREHYDVESYRRAIQRACDLARIPRWSPNQLRHAAATRIRREEGLEAARVILGHSRVSVTEVYAEADHERSLRIMERHG